MSQGFIAAIATLALAAPAMAEPEAPTYSQHRLELETHGALGRSPSHNVLGVGLRYGWSLSDMVQLEGSVAYRSLYGESGAVGDTTLLRDPQGSSGRALLGLRIGQDSPSLAMFGRIAGGLDIQRFTFKLGDNDPDTGPDNTTFSREANAVTVEFGAGMTVPVAGWQLGPYLAGAYLQESAVEGLIGDDEPGPSFEFMLSLFVARSL